MNFHSIFDCLFTKKTAEESDKQYFQEAMNSKR